MTSSERLVKLLLSLLLVIAIHGSVVFSTTTTNTQEFASIVRVIDSLSHMHTHIDNMLLLLGEYRLY